MSLFAFSATSQREGSRYTLRIGSSLPFKVGRTEIGKEVQGVIRACKVLPVTCSANPTGLGFNAFRDNNHKEYQVRTFATRHALSVCMRPRRHTRMNWIHGRTSFVFLLLSEHRRTLLKARAEQASRGLNAFLQFWFSWHPCALNIHQKHGVNPMFETTGFLFRRVFFSIPNSPRWKLIESILHFGARKLNSVNFLPRR